MRMLVRSKLWAGLLAASAMALAVPAPAWAAGQDAPAQVAEITPVEIRTPALTADYYPGLNAETGAGAVIVLGGSEGGLESASRMARRLAMEGIPAIAVGYFGLEGLPAVLNEVPIEPVAAARGWLEARPGHDGRLAILGVSKGAELALLVASRDPAIEAVVAGVPTHLVWQGIDMTGGPTGASWTEGGEPLAYTPYDLSGGFRGILQLYADSLDDAPEGAFIPVERINGPVLLVSGGRDGLWPSADMAGLITARLEANGFAHPVESLVYAEAGHAAFGPPITTVSPQMEQQIGFLGGTVEGTVAARADGWPRVVAFLRAALAED